MEQIAALLAAALAERLVELVRPAPGGQHQTPLDLAHVVEVLVQPGAVGGAQILLQARHRALHEVEQALPCRADDRDDIGSLSGRGLRLRDVLVDVAGGDDEVDPRGLLRVTMATDQPVADRALGVDGAYAACHRSACGPLGGLEVARGDDARHARPSMRLGSGFSKRVKRSGTRAVSNAMLISGSNVSPMPPATICASVKFLLVLVVALWCLAAVVRRLTTRTRARAT